tara:strand:- start:48 stop:365 length:318 start_codon:yes stop_codon:yes gene_type:complete
MTKIKKIFSITLLSILLFSCQGFSDAKKIMRNEKVTSTDEFLVKKKNPLVLPPDFEKIPKPGTIKNNNKSEKQKLEEILNVEINENNKKIEATSSEQSILNQIRK